MKKALALILAMLMCLFVLVACSGDSGEGGGKGNGSGGGNGNGGDGEGNVDPNRPAVEDFSEYTFTIMNDSFCDYEPAAPEELNGEGINDAMYNRNKKVESLYGISIIEIGESDQTNTSRYPFLQQMNSSQDYYADLYSNDAAGMLNTMSTTGWFANIYDLKNLRLQNEYWDQEYMAETTYNGYCYTLTGNIMTSDDIHEISLMMNLTKFKAAFPDQSIYDIVVKDGTWTIEKFFEIWESYPEAKDQGTLGVVDSDDVVSYAWDGKTGTYFFISSNLPSFRMENGQPNIENIKSTKAYNIRDWLQRIYDGKTGFQSGCAGGSVSSNCIFDYDTVRAHFAAGKVLFVTNNFGDALGWYLDMADDVVYLPYPKYDTDQLEYYTPVHWCFEPIAISNTVDDLDRTALITEALAYYSNELENEVMGVLLQERLSSEAEPRGILQTTLRAKKYDLDYIATVTGFTSKVDSLLVNGTLSEFASSVATIEKNAIKTNGKGSVQRFSKNYAHMEF